MTNLELQIENLELQIQNSGCKYKIKSLKSKLGWLKSELKGNFINVQDLKEYRKLIIFMINKSLYFRTQSNLIEVMTELKRRIEEDEIIFKTKRGIKGLIVQLCKTISLDLCFGQLGDDMLGTGVSGYDMRNKFTQFRINTLM